VDIEVNNLHISRITIKDLVGYVYIIRIDVCVVYDSKNVSSSHVNKRITG
jgi:hypothetical protein